MATSAVQFEFGGLIFFLSKCQDHLLNGKDSKCSGHVIVALSRLQRLSDYKLMAISAVHFELGGSAILPLNCLGRLLEGKDSDYWGGDNLVLSHWQGLSDYQFMVSPAGRHFSC